MKKNIYTGIFYTILGLCINTPANASLISRGFLDQALTDYATTTALDLKANQSDFTELNTQISDSVDVLRLLLRQGSPSYEFVNNIDPEKFPNTISGAFNLLYQYLNNFAGSVFYGWTDPKGTYYRGFRELNNGWTDSENKTYLGVKGLNDKIGTLPSGNLDYSLILEALFKSSPATDTTDTPVYPNSLADLINQLYGNGAVGPGIIDSLLYGFVFDEYGEVGILPAMYMAETAQETATEAKTAAETAQATATEAKTTADSAKELAESNATAIGTLPDGNIGSPYLEEIYHSNFATANPVYPKSLSDLINQLYGNNEFPGIFDVLMNGFEVDEYGDVGILSAFSMAKKAQKTATEAKTAADTNTAKIGTVPTEYETVGAALSAIKGIAEEAKAAALAAIPDPKTEGSNGKYVLTVDILEGDATYRWEPIDRGNTTTTTE